jgi:hypothetical protein
MRGLPRARLGRQDVAMFLYADPSGSGWVVRCALQYSGHRDRDAPSGPRGEPPVEIEALLRALDARVAVEK